MSQANENANNGLPNNVIQMRMQNWTDPAYFEESENLRGVTNLNLPRGEYFVVNGEYVRGNNTLSQHGLVVSNNEFSDPDDYNVPNSPNLHTIKRLPVIYNTSRRKKMVVKRKHKTVKKSKSKAKAKTSTRNNRFGFKTAFSTLGKKLSKLTRGSKRL